MGESGENGRFLWYDLMTTDPEGAQAFYAAVVGWGIQTWEERPDDLPPYVMFAAGDEAMGGVMQLPADAVEQGAPHMELRGPQD